MQQVSTALYTAIEQGIVPSGSGPRVRDLTWLFELYNPSTLPGVNGLDPTSAVARFASSEITWLGLAYRRILLSASDISIKRGQEANRCTLRLSNADENRLAATFIQQNQVEGMRLVVRLISRSASATLADSAVRFIGRCDKPEGFDAIQGSITANAGLGDKNHEWPPRSFDADDPEGRSPSDVLYEGFPFITLSGTFTHQRVEPDKRFSRRDPRRYFATLPWSSYDETPLGDPIMMVLGRSQVRVYRGVFADTGRATFCLDFVCMGPIAGILNFRMDNSPEYQKYFTQPENITYHLGDAGGTGTNLADPMWPNHPLFSYTAYVTYSFRYIGTGAFSQIDAGHDTVMVVLGMVVPLPNASGVFNQSGWTDNGAYLTRFLITNSRFLNLNPAFIEDSTCYATGLENDRPVVDDSNAEEILIPEPEIDSAGVEFLRYRSTSLIDTGRALYDLGLDSTRPEARDVADFTAYALDSPPVLIADVRRLRKQFTTNILLKKKVKGQDFLFNTILPSFRGYTVWNWRGKLDIRSERPADFAHLRGTVSPAATTLPVEDVTPWKATGGLWGYVLTGAGLTTSEARKVTAAAYTTDANLITLAAAATGGLTATASGATLSGGSSSAQATGTITLSGTPSAGAQAAATIAGIEVAHTLISTDTLATAAYMLAQHINANTQLRRFVSAAASGAVVTVKSKWGVLTLSAALANTHGGPVPNPTAAPAGLTSSGSGTPLQAGTYTLAYANRNANGSTYVSPAATITITAGKQINVPALALPAGVTSRDWFLSKAAGETEVVLHSNRNGSGFAITSLPSSTAAPPPEYNTTGEEVVRVALPFASANQTPAILAQSGLSRGNIVANSYKWPLSGQQPTYTQIIGNYVSAKDDFAASKVEVNDKAARERLGKTNPRELDLTAVDGWPQARRLVYFDFAKYIDHHWFNALKSNGLALLLEEDDVICASDDSGGHVNVLTRIEELTIHLADFTVSITKARQYSSRMFRELVPKTRPLLPSVLRYVTTLDTTWQIFDIPATSEEDRKRSIVRIAARPADGTGDWQGYTVWVDSGAGYKQVAAKDTRAAFGTLVTAMPTANPSAFVAGPVRVTVGGGETLSTRTEAEVLEGANFARAAGRIFRFKTATLISSTATTKTYDLGGIQSGLFGTEDEAAGIGAEFTLLDGAELEIDWPLAWLNKTVQVKVLTVNRDLAQTTAKAFTWGGRSVAVPVPTFSIAFDGNTLVHNTPNKDTRAVKVQFSKANDHATFVSTDPNWIGEGTSTKWLDPSLAGDPRSGTRYARFIGPWGNPSAIVPASYNVQAPAAPVVTLQSGPTKALPNAAVFRATSPESADKRKTFRKTTFQTSLTEDFAVIYQTVTKAGPGSSAFVDATLNKPAGERRIYVRAWFSDVFTMSDGDIGYYS